MYRNIGNSETKRKKAFLTFRFLLTLLDGGFERFIKVYPDGRFLTRDLKTNSLVLSSPGCKVLKTIPGEVYYEHTQEVYDRLPKFQNNSGDMIMLWRKNQATIAVLNLEEFKIKKEISNFWTYKQEVLEEQLAICDSSMMNVIGISKLKDKSRIFHHYTKEGKIVNFQMDKLMPDLNVWHCMSMCVDKDQFFVAGTSSLNPNIGVLFAVFECTVPIKIVTAIQAPNV